jgi:uncharacterized membrane-anchored protein YhcB (DUF1043 family)
MEKKWYHQWWVYVLIALIFLLLGALIFREKDRVAQEEILKTEIEDLVKQTKTLDSLYRAAAAEKDKIKVIREKIDITQDIKKLQQLINELDDVRSEPIKRNSSTLELKQYLETEF